MKKHIYSILAMGIAGLLFCGCQAIQGDDTGGINQQSTDAADTQEESAGGSADENALAEPAQEQAEGSANQEDSLTEDDNDAFNGDNSKEKDESPAVGYMMGDHEKTYEGIKAYLKTLSDDPEELVRAGGIVVSDWDSVAGMRNLIAFEELYLAGQETEIVMVRYTEEGDPIFDYLYYDGADVWHVTDSSRDAWAAPEYAYTEERYPFLLIFTQKAEERDRLHSLVLSRQDGLTYDECTQMPFGNENGNSTVNFLASFFYTDADL